MSKGVMFACNDYRNGHSQGWFDAVSYEPWEMELDGPPVRFDLLSDNGTVGRRLRIGHCIFEFTYFAEWVGNWCWNEVGITDRKKLWRYLKKRGYTCSVGPTPIYNWFNSQPPEAKQ